jgi:hypothetical protein
MSLLAGPTKMVASSTYKDVLIPLARAKMGCRIPCSVAKWRIRWSGSMTRMNNMGEMGSLYRRPLSCLMGLPGIPLRRILDEAVDSARLIHSLHLVLNPNLSITSKM